MLKFELLLLKSVKNDVHGNMQTIIISVDITELKTTGLAIIISNFARLLKKPKRTKIKMHTPSRKLLLVEQTFVQSAIICQRDISLSPCQNSAYPPQRNFSLSCGLLYKAPSYVNVTFLCRVAKIVHTPLKETSPCCVDFCQSAIICQRDISLSRCQNSAYPPQGNFSLSCGRLFKAPSQVNATFLCRVAKIMYTPLKETSPCRVDFCSKSHHRSTRHFFVALPK